MFHSVDFTNADQIAADKVTPLPTRPNAAVRGAASEGPGLLRRPRLLSRAAREGAKLYKRDRDLHAALPGAAAPGGAEQIVARLMQAEAQIEADRRAHAAGYSPARHVHVLSALVAEALAIRNAKQA